MKSGSVFLAISALLAFAGTVQAQQASLTLGDSNAEFCHRHDNAWTLTKTGTLSNSSVTWTVTATKDSSGPAWIQADGYLVVTNTGTAPATIGNIVVNLQKRYKQKWVSAAADVADATSGDAATTANIVAKASQEDPTLNLAHGAGNYTITGARGTFVETAGSGALSFVDASNNTLFSLVPQVSLAPGQSVALLYQAGFNNAVLGLGAGAQVRVEVIVTFGNAGPRGGSGASATNIDINGNGTIDADENWVRSVPTRISRDLPPLEECNNNVLLIDQQSDVAVTGTVAYSNYTSTIPGDGITWLSDSATYTITCDVNGGTNGGTITNTATLTGVTETVTVNGPIDPLTGLPKYSTSFICCLGVNLTASSTLVVPGDDPGPPPGFTPGEFTTFT